MYVKVRVLTLDRIVIVQSMIQTGFLFVPIADIVSIAVVEATIRNRIYRPIRLFIRPQLLGILQTSL